jgi:uncharacterized protein
MQVMAAPRQSLHQMATQIDLDAVVHLGTEMFAQGMWLFVFLFGFGIAMQMQRPGASTGFFIRRLGLLLGVGLLHALLLWSGDILFLYACCGLFLLLFRRDSPLSLLGWGIAFWLLALLLPPAFVLLTSAAPLSPASASPDHAQTTTLALYRSADMVAQTGRRAYEFVVLRLNSLLSGATFLALAMMLFGMAAQRSGALTNLASPPRWLQRMSVIHLPVGLVGIAVALFLRMSPIPLVGALGESLRWLFEPFFVSGYAAAVLVESHTRQRAVWMEAVAAVGRMTLTNYIGQSLVALLIFTGIGLGLYGTLTALQVLVIALGILLCQVLLSTWWLQRYAQGPLEWLWRVGSSWRWQPLQRANQPYRAGSPASPEQPRG